MVSGAYDRDDDDDDGRKRNGAAERRAFIKRGRTNAAIKTKPTAFVRDAARLSYRRALPTSGTHGEGRRTTHAARGDAGKFCRRKKKWQLFSTIIPGSRGRETT